MVPCLCYAVPCASIVTLLYWNLDFTGHTDVIDFNEHAVNVSFMLVDLTVTRWPFFLRHMYMGWIYIWVYITFHSLYVTMGGTDAVSSFG